MTLLLLFLLLHFAEASHHHDLRTVRVKPGADVLLECHSSGQGAVSLVEWSRADLASHGYIFYYRDERAYRNFQHPSFVDRVQLRDPQMKDGDVSVFVNHVTVNDTGTYECYVSTINKSDGRRKRASAGTSRTIELLVEEEEEEGSDVHGATWSRSNVAGPAAALIITAAAAAAAVALRHKKQSSAVCGDDEGGDDDEDSDEQLV